MFRKKILEKMSTPDSLDQLLVVVTPKSELTLGALAATLVVTIVWSCVAEIPVTVDGQGILLEPRSIRTIQAPSSGNITDLLHLVGDQVKAGEVIARIDQSEMARPLEQQVARYLSTRRFNTRVLEQAARKRDLELELNTQGLDANRRDIETLQKLRTKVGAQLDAVNALQALELAKSRQLLQKLKAANTRQLANVTALVDEGVVSVSRLMGAEASVADIEGRIGELDIRIKQTEMSKLESEQRDLKLGQELTALEATRQQLTIRRQQIQQEYEVEEQRKRQELEEMAASIRLTREKLHRLGSVRSPYAGKILEVTISVGQHVSGGGRVAMLHTEAQHPVQRLELAPDTAGGTFVLLVEGHETGPLPYNASSEQVLAALLALPPVKAQGGKIAATGRLPQEPIDFRFVEPPTRPGASEFLDLAVKDADLYSDDEVPAFASITSLADRIPEEDLKHLGFFPIGQGLKVAAGMEIRVTPSNVERQRFGSIIGKVIDVSPFPVTSEGIVNVVGSSEVAKSLISGGGTILVTAELEKDPKSVSGFQWTSQGPPQRFSPGTTTQCRITVENRRPITFVIPLLRKWLLGQGDKLPTPTAIPGG